VLFDFFAVPLPAGADAGYLFDCVKAQAGDLVKRLNLHKMRAKIAIADKSDMFGVAAVFGGEVPTGIEGVVYHDARAPGMGLRVIAPREALARLKDAGEAAYEAHRIAQGVPKGGVDFAYGDAFVHDVNLDLMNGVDFKKAATSARRLSPAFISANRPASASRKSISMARRRNQARRSWRRHEHRPNWLDGRNRGACDDPARPARRRARGGAVIKAGEATADVHVTPEFLAAAAGVEKRL